MAQYLSIGTTSNTRFYQDLLETLGISSHVGDGAVVISDRVSVRKAHEIGMFRYASSRKENLGKLVKMIDTIDNSLPTIPEEMDHIKEQRRQGKSWGAISESLYDQFGHTWPHYTIQRRFEKPESYGKRREPAQSN